MSRGPSSKPRLAALRFASLWLSLGVTACGPQIERFLSVPIPASYQDGLLSVYGEALTSRDERCQIDPGANPPDRPPSSRMLLDLGTPFTVVSDAQGRTAEPFPHGQVQINATAADGTMGASRFLLCDMPLVRGSQAPTELRLDRTAPGAPPASTGTLGAVLGADLFAHYQVALDWPAPMNLPQFTLSRSDITPTCLKNETVIPFVPVGGDLMVEVGDSILSYPPNRVTIGACVEPLADPLVLRASPMTPTPTVQSCIDPSRLVGALATLDKQISDLVAATVPDANRLGLLRSYRQAVAALQTPSCGDVTDLALLGDVVAALELRRPPYTPTGVNMRFLLSTAVPDLVLSQTACSRLAPVTAGIDRCACADADRVALRLPGMNGPQPDGSNPIEYGCRIQLGGTGRAGLALVAAGLQLSPCAELARSRRQRFAPPQLTDAEKGPTDCLREACLENLARQSNLTSERCGYTGMLVAQACDDHQAQVSALVELGGPTDDGRRDDIVEALVVPDTARILQSVNADVRNATSQVDGILGTSLLRRLHAAVDYPQNRVAMSCPCTPTSVGGTAGGDVCRAYHGLSYNYLDSCVPSSTIVIPADYGHAACRQ